MNPTLKGIDQWPNTVPAIGALDASYSAAQEDRIIPMKEPSENLKKLLEDLKRMTPEEMDTLKLNLICNIAAPSLPSSSTATSSEAPDRVETSELNPEWLTADFEWPSRKATEWSLFMHTQKPRLSDEENEDGQTGFVDVFSVDQMKSAFRAGYEAGRKAK